MSASETFATGRRLVTWLAFGLLSLLGAASAGAATVAPAEAASKIMREDLAAPLRSTGEVRVIVGLQTVDELSKHGVRLRDRDAEVVASTRQNALMQRLSGTGSREHKRLRWHPFMALTVDANGLARLLSDPTVTTVAVDEARHPVLQDTPTITRATQAWAAGARGAGRAVAIIDSGVDRTHPFFTGKIVAEACFSTPVGTGVGYCPGGASSSTAAGSGVPCPDYALGCWHGTHVAGIAVGKSGVLGSTSGIAPDAGVIAVQVFQRPCAGCTIVAYDSDILAALEHVYSLRATHSIAAVNLSLGGGTFADTCDAMIPAYKAIFDTLRSANIAPVVSSGNGSSSAGISAPACVSSAISVGSTTKQGAISSFSNSSTALQLLAPGSGITSSVPLAYVAGGFGGANGTSMAAPHVAGAWAALRSVVPPASVDSVLTALQLSGVPVTDARNGLVRSLIQVGDSGGQLGALGLLRRPPTVSVTAPANGATYPAPANIGISASATPNATGAVIARVEYYAGGSKVGEATNPPYGVSWTGVTQGSYTLTAQAIDSYGNVAASIPVGVTVTGVNYTIAGTVTLGGSALSGVVLAASNGGSCSSSNVAGQYSCTVPAGWSGTVTPTLAGYTFTPASRSYSALAANQVAQDYAAAATTLSISGTITLNGSALSGVNLAASNGGSCGSSNAAGQYSCTVPAGWSGTVTPTVAGYTFTPASRSYSALAANQAAQDYGAVAMAVSYIITGTVTLNGSALSGVNLTASNGGSCGSTNAAGQYGCTVPAGWSGTVTPSLSGHVFTPVARRYISVAANQSLQDYGATAATVWFDDATPAGATLVGQTDGWNWVASNPTPVSGTLAHQSALLSGEHQHHFISATNPLAVGVGDTLFAYVYLDPVNPPSEIMLKWNDGSWEHRAYWGANIMQTGVDGTASRRSMGALPPPGQWVRLEVPAALVGLEGRTVTGMAFTTYNGRTTWDYTGKIPPAAAATYQIGGTITLNGSALSGVNLAASNGGSCGSSNAAGQYSCTVPAGWSGTVTPTLAGYKFTPASRSYSALAANQAAQDYAAAVVNYTIAGAVTLGGSALSGVSFGASNGGNCSTSNATGQYSCTVPAGWSGTVTPTLVGYAFAPTSRSYASVSANQVVQDYSAATVSYTMSGTVTLNGSALSGVSFGASNGGSCGSSNAAGQYSCTVPAGWSGTVTPALAGYTFTPVSRSYSALAANQTAQDYTAATVNYTISGAVTLNGGALSGVSLAASNGGSCGSSNASGQYSCTVPFGWSGTVTPTLTGYTFAPVSRSYAALAANQTAQDYAAAAVATSYTIAGTVTLGGNAFSGVNLAASNGGSCGASNAAGQYICTVPAGWTGTVTPSLSGHVFTPVARSYNSVAANQSLQDYGATAATVWFDDAAPAGATLVGQTDGWNWVASNPTPVSGTLAHQSALLAGEHQHHFISATNPLVVGVGDTLFAYVYLDPANPPSEIMLKWNDGSWEHRAYWGANIMQVGVNGTASRRSMGALPPTGQWVRLEVPAALVGLEGRTVIGMAFTTYNGRTTWDYTGTRRP